MADTLVKVLGTFLIAGLTAAAGAIIEEVQNFGKERKISRPLSVTDWKHFANFNQPQVSSTVKPPVMPAYPASTPGYTAPARPAYTPPAIPSTPYRPPANEAYRIM